MAGIRVFFFLSIQTCMHFELLVDKLTLKSNAKNHLAIVWSAYGKSFQADIRHTCSGARISSIHTISIAIGMIVFICIAESPVAPTIFQQILLSVESHVYVLACLLACVRVCACVCVYVMFNVFTIFLHICWSIERELDVIDKHRNYDTPSKNGPE